ncbi:MAG: hypothetical protein JXR69_08720 [Candidatus Delongbacteria bacterium]|nr:hypothetical protein [Candidatus Delongbacteria bacterium]
MFRKFSSTIFILIFAISLLISSCGKTDEVDIMLAQYEKMIEKYMPLMEKASKGAVEGLDEEMAKMTKEMEDWGKKWEPMIKELSAEQTKKVQKRMMEIAQKMYQK